MKRRLTVILALLATVALTTVACSSGSSNAGSQPKTFLAVRLTNPSDFATEGSACHGVGAFADVTAGEPVAVIETGGITGSTTQLRDGIKDTSGACEFDEPLDVPLAMSYTVVIGTRPPSDSYDGNVGLITISLD